MLEKTIKEKLSKNFKGQIIQAGDAGYDEERKVWNGFFDKYPLAIARCTEPSDVMAALEFARAQQLKLAVRGGGHDYAGNSVCDDGLVIDLSLMNKVEVNAETKTAWVQGGATCGEFDAKAQEYGLATTLGTASSIGVAGLTLGGGSGYLARKHGLALDNLLAVEIVTADGRLLTASREENDDLFWAIRGGGGNFGVVTSFKFSLHEVGPEVLLSQAFYPYRDLREVLQFYREFMVGAPDELLCYPFIIHTPPLAPFPEEFHGKTACALIACYSGDQEKGWALLQPLEKFGEPFFNFVQPIAYTELQKSFDAGMPKGLRWYSRAHYLPDLGDKIIDTLQKYTDPLPGAYTMVYFEPQGGALGRVDPAATAFPHRNAAFSIHIMTGWDDPQHDDDNINWAKAFFQALAPHATGGVYVNLLSHDEEERVKAAYGENWDRLAKLKRKWDPNNVFGMNHNIKAEG